MELTDWEKRCLASLSELATGAGNAWSHGKAQLYLAVLRNLGEEASKRATEYAILNCEWRPEPARLREIAANLYSPLPPVGACWREVWDKAITAGYTDPRWTHPVIEDLVAAVGGWSHLRNTCWPDTPDRTRDQMRYQFEQAYKDRAGTWWKAVADQLQFPPQERDPHLFPNARPYVPMKLEPADTGAPKALPAGDAAARLRELGADRIGKVNGKGNGNG